MNMEENKISLQPESSSTNPDLPMESREMRFTVPWGHIAAKSWGNAQGQPILAIHGLQDSAATFDTLVPIVLKLVGQPLYIVCLDLPGHGFSSHLPPGIPYHFMDMLSCIRRVTAQLGWQRFHFMGHSLGGLLGYYFAASYPDVVEKLIVIDAVSFKLFPFQYQLNIFRGYANRILESEKKEQERTDLPAYTLDTILNKIAQSRGTKMTEIGLKALASRNIQPTEGPENSYYFSLDHRLKFMDFPVMYHDEAIQIMKQVKCQVLVIVGNESLGSQKESYNKSMLKALQENCSYFKYHIVEGDHDAHLNFPERFASYMAKFLREPSSSL